MVEKMLVTGIRKDELKSFCSMFTKKTETNQVVLVIAH